MKLRRFLASVLLLMAALPSWSAQDLGTIDASGTEFSKDFIRFFGFGSPLGAFVDEYTFQIAGAGAAAGGAVSFDFGFVDLQLTSVSLTGGGQSQTSSTPGNFSFANLVPNVTYTLAVAGTLSSYKFLDLGYAYYEGTIRSVASAAPEPGALALALAGLLGVGVLTRRRIRL